MSVGKRKKRWGERGEAEMLTKKERLEEEGVVEG
jgi:hypothetical protein